MAITHGKSTKVYLNGYNLTGILNKASGDFKQDVFPTPVFGLDSRPKIYGNEDGEVKLEGWLDNAVATATVLPDAMQAAGGSHVAYMPDGGAFGASAHCAYGHAAEYGEPTDDAPNKITATIESTTGLELAKVLVPFEDMTVSENGASHDNGAATANGGAAFLQVFDYDGITSVDVKIQHSTNDSIWADLATFTQVTADRACERLLVAAGTTVHRYTRAVVTIAGVGSVEVFAAFGRK